jgi:hypothetical protein
VILISPSFAVDTSFVYTPNRMPEPDGYYEPIRNHGPYLIRLEKMV